MKRIAVVLSLAISVNAMAIGTINTEILRKYKETAIKNNLELQIEGRKLDDSNSKVYQAGSSFLPKVDFNARITNFDKARSIPINGFDFTINPKKNTETKIEATQVLFSPAIVYNYLIQKNLNKSDRYEYSNKVSELEFNVLQAYYNCLKAKELVEMRKSALELAKESYNVTEKLYKVEKVPETDLLRAQVGLISGQQDIMDAENQFNLARNYFNSVLNRGMNEEIETDVFDPDELLNVKIQEISGDVESLESLINQAIENRSEVKQMYLGFRSTKYAKRIMMSDFLPSMAAAYSYGYSGEDFSYKEDQKSWSISGVLSWNLFSGFNSSAKAYEVNSQVKQMEKSYENTKHLIELDVRNNYLDFQHSKSQFEVAQKAYQTALSNYRMVKKQYENELAPMINLTDSKNLLDSSKANLIVSYFNVLISRARLDKSVCKEIIK
jgi:outer membrane protein TolC